MPYSPPTGAAANFTARGYDEPGFVSHAYRFPAGTYSAQPGNGLLFVLPAYIYPSGDAVRFVVPANSAIEGIGAVTLDITASGLGEFTNVAVDAEGAAEITVVADGLAAHGIAGSGSVSLPLDASSQSAHGIAGAESVTLPITVTGTGLVERYELLGEVRLQGVLVDRVVRAYRRDTGELVGAVNTVSGKFRLHTGFAASEHYLVPIHDTNDAEDFAPPCANRVLSVLAQDAA